LAHCLRSRPCSAIAAALWGTEFSHRCCAHLPKSSLDHTGVKPAILRWLGRFMSHARIILAFLVALSVAVLPAAAGTGVELKPTSMSDMSAMGDDCCPPEDNPCGKAMGDCTSMAACALKCFGFSDTAYSIVAFPSIPVSLNSPFESNSFRSQIGSPPFRPPR